MSFLGVREEEKREGKERGGGGAIKGLREKKRKKGTEKTNINIHSCKDHEPVALPKM